MERKISSIIALAIMFLVAIPVHSAFISTGIGNVVTTPQPGKYYFIQGNAQHDDIITWLYDSSDGLTAGVGDEPSFGENYVEFVWTFEVTDEGYAAKNNMTGRYICIEGTSNGGKVTMQDTPSYFSIEVKGEEVAFKNASGQYIDMAYDGISPVTWSGGVSGSRRLTIYEAIGEAEPDLQDALRRLTYCFENYEDYYYNWDDLIERGTEVGQYNYSDKDYQDFFNSMLIADAWVCMTPDEIAERSDDITVESINELINDIDAAFARIMASLVTLTIADGNYRIVSALEWTNTIQINTGEVDENGNPLTETVTIHPTKAMYATLDGKAMWADIDSTDCRYLWKITNNAETGLIQMMNIATDGILNDCSKSSPATLTADSKTEMKFEFIERRDGKTIVAMKPSTRGDYGFLHCNGHGGGSGTASNIVGWEASAGASQWILELVTDEEVEELVDAYAPIKDHEILVARFKEAIAEAEALVAQAKDDQYITEREALITSTSQFSSPFTDPQEGSFENVLNDDANSFWHSDWHNGEPPMHTHYFQVSFEEPIEGNIQCFMRRRNALNDHITLLSVYATNDVNLLDSEEEEDWDYIELYDLSKPVGAGTTVYSNPLEISPGYRYFRFYIDETTNNRGYGHFATFQLYRVSIDGNTQWSQMGEDAIAIETALAAAKAINMDEVEMSDYNALKAAIEAFKAVLADPSALAATLAANKDFANLIAIGDAPGFWKAISGDVASPAFTIKAATEYLKSGAYTQEKLDAYTEAVKKVVSDIMAMANPVEPGKWYALKFDSEENYDTRNWSKDPAVNTTLGDLFNNYVAPANIKEDVLVGFENLEDIAVGQALHFIDDETIQAMDQVAFRFVAQGDSAFVIQHKSGLYLNGNRRSTNLTLGLTPALFTVRAVGYGKVIIEARDLKGQGYYDNPVYLHAQNDGHSLVTWDNDIVSSNSALYIEPIDEDDFYEGNDVQESALMRVQPNNMTFMCYPTAFSVEGAEIYAYQGAFPDDTTEGDLLAYYAFNKVEQAEAGQPVLLVVGDPSTPKLPVIEVYGSNRLELLEEIHITPLGTSFATDPLTSGGVHGTYTYEWVDEGTVVVGDSKLGQTIFTIVTLVLAEGAEGTNCTRDISANTGYIVYGENILKNASVDDFDYVITASRPNVTYLRGDVNLDGRVDIADAVTVLNVMAGQEVLGNADVNEDNYVDIADFVTVLNIMAGR